MQIKPCENFDVQIFSERYPSKLQLKVQDWLYNECDPSWGIADADFEVTTVPIEGRAPRILYSPALYLRRIDPQI